MPRIDRYSRAGDVRHRLGSFHGGYTGMTNPPEFPMTEVATIKRARRLLRICDIAMTMTGEDRAAYLARACIDDQTLHTEAEAILASVEDKATFLLDFDLFPSLPPRSS
ncbi:MAG: hypothetical protein AB8F65_00340 [Woeseiaceae bacterium]